MNLQVPSREQIASACQNVRSRWETTEADRRHRQAEQMQRRLAMLVLLGKGSVALQPARVVAR